MSYQHQKDVNVRFKLYSHQPITEEQIANAVLAAETHLNGSEDLGLREIIRTVRFHAEVTKPKVFMHMTETGIELSDRTCEAEDYDSNYIELKEVGRPTHAEGIRNIVGNILRNAGVEVIEE